MKIATPSARSFGIFLERKREEGSLFPKLVDKMDKLGSAPN